MRPDVQPSRGGLVNDLPGWRNSLVDRGASAAVLVDMDPLPRAPRPGERNQQSAGLGEITSRKFPDHTKALLPAPCQVYPQVDDYSHFQEGSLRSRFMTLPTDTNEELATLFTTYESKVSFVSPEKKKKKTAGSTRFYSNHKCRHPPFLWGSRESRA